MDTLQIDDLQFEVRRSARRRSLEITVDRGGELILSVPTDCPDERLRDFVRRKRMWIYRLRLVPPGESTDRARPWLAHKVKDYSARMEDDPAACAHRRIRRGA